jgi:hypothetical protein
VQYSGTVLEVALSQIVGCLACRQVFKSVPECCPFCNGVTFLHLNEREDLNSVCEELLSLAMSIRMKSDKSRSKRCQTKNQETAYATGLG